MSGALSFRLPMIIAEMSGNHNGDYERACAILRAAHAAGADAIKLQTYTADTMTIDCDNSFFQVRGGLWDGHKLFNLYQKAHTPWEWHAGLFGLAQSLSIKIFSTPFDKTAVDFLEKLNAPFYKIASFEVIDHELIAYAAQTKKPMIISTGMAVLEEIEAAVEIARSNGCRDLTLMHCVSAYPANVEDANLATMVDLQKRFPSVSVGLSDHTMGTVVSLAAVALGAVAIEKHFTLKRSDGGVDSSFSLEPEELRHLCDEARKVASAIGTVDYSLSAQEKESLIFRRSLFVVRDVYRGDVLTREHVRCIRPGNGLAPKFIDQILGKKAAKDARRGTPVTWDLV